MEILRLNVADVNTAVICEKQVVRYSAPQNLFPLPTGSIFSFATLGSALGKDYAGAIVTLFCGTL
jgi:hypothetical protein